jgi:hypothetical protein
VHCGPARAPQCSAHHHHHTQEETHTPPKTIEMNRLNMTSGHVVCTPCAGGGSSVLATAPVAAEGVVAGECNW